MQQPPEGGVVNESGATHQSLRRAVTILRIFTENEPSLTVGEIARRLDLHKSTVSRILSTLADEGLVWHDTATGRYSLGLGLVELAGVALGQIDVRSASMPHIERLANLTGETVTVCVLREREAVTVAHVASRHSVRHVSWIGRRLPLRTTAAGKVFLAALATRGQAWMTPPETGNFDRTEILPAMASEYRVIRKRGIAMEVDEFEVGSVAIAAAIQDATGAVVAAVSIGGPTERFGSDERRTAIPMLRATAADIATGLGATSEASA
jgi:DNA-binding IclR family transcriptional regulator